MTSDVVSILHPNDDSISLDVCMSLPSIMCPTFWAEALSDLALGVNGAT